MINPKKVATTGLMLLEEAVLAILSEQPDLQPAQISKLLDITSDDYGIGSSDYPIVRSVLIKLENEERVERDKPKNANWRLTESESRERRNTYNSSLS